MTLPDVPLAMAASPLLSLTAAVVDTESTSLDVKSGRIVEIGAVALIDGALVDGAGFSQLVNPGLAIPANATAIHGIRDQDVASALSFPEVYAVFSRYVGAHVWLGYALDFDTALMSSACQRHGLSFKRPSTLDVRSLVRVLNPTLPDHALETVAHWQGIAIDNRHRAEADARLTAAVFLALIPALRARGIRTLAEAQVACRKVEEQASGLFGAELVAHPGLARVDSYPYRRRVSDVMSSPPLVIAASLPLKDAMATMVARKVSSLFVEGDPFGIITERDCLRAVVQHHTAALSHTVSQHASTPLLTVRQDDFVYHAIGAMRRRAIRHLGAVDGTGTLVGALSQRDLLRMRAEEALALTNALSDAATPQELANVWRKLSVAAQSLLDEDVDAHDIAAIISGEVCALTARAAQMAERENASDRPAGLRYAVFVLGSAARGESLLALDQDNAIVFDTAEDETAQAWLLRIATRMNAILDEIGVPFCKGGVMARNPAWCMSVAEWRRKINRWFEQTDPADLLNADIFFDSLPVHGELSLAESLRTDAITAASRSEAFLKLMSLHAASAGSPLNWLGRFQLDERGRIDLKRYGLMPIFTAARVAALRAQVSERSTLARLSVLRGRKEAPQRELEAILVAQAELMRFVLRQQLADIAGGVSPSTHVDPSGLSAVERERLKWDFKQVQSVIDLVGAPQI